MNPRKKKQEPKPNRSNRSVVNELIRGSDVAKKLKDGSTGDPE